MRREGFEIVASQPRVLTREVNGKLCEPVERLAIDVPEDYVGVVTQMLALRKGRMEQMVNHSTGWVRLDYLAPARGLIGFRTEFLTETRGTGILHHVFEALGAVGRRAAHPPDRLAGLRPRRDRPRASPCTRSRTAAASSSAPARTVYEGMIVGENSRADDLDVNATKQKHQTNVRAASADILVRLIPPRTLSLENALEFLREDECVEITPESLRLRKAELAKVERVKLRPAGRASA